MGFNASIYLRQAGQHVRSLSGDHPLSGTAPGPAPKGDEVPERTQSIIHPPLGAEFISIWAPKIPIAVQNRLRHLDHVSLAHINW